ncbi:MAG: hypothetical protein ACODAQ_12350, partial [Phycisphaeraceae bacterium]
MALVALAGLWICTATPAAHAAGIDLGFESHQPRAGGVSYGISRINTYDFGYELSEIDQFVLEAPDGSKLYSRRSRWARSLLPSHLSYEELHNMAVGQWSLTANLVTGESPTWQFSINDYTSSDLPPADQMRITEPTDGAGPLGPTIRFRWEHGTLED